MVPSQKPDEAALRQLAQALLPSTAAQDDLGWLQSCLDALENSELGREMAAAAARGELLHELPFDARGAVHNTPLTLSGRIDALFRDAGGHWVVIDYKLTQKGPLQYRNELQGSYAKQLLAYQAALSACGIGPLGRAGLWLAASGEVVWLLG